MAGSETSNKETSSVPTCMACGGAGSFFLRAGDSFYEVTDYVADLYRCETCTALFQWPVPHREVIAGFYPSGYWREETQTGVMSRLQSFYIGAMLKLDLMKWVKHLKLGKMTRYLDVGCSRGDWLDLIQKEGIHAQGLEADPRAADYARRRFGLQVEEVDAENWQPEEGRFDVISFFHLLEHLGSPGTFLALCHRALDHQGRILLRVPNAGSWQMRLFGKRWKGLELPRHLVLFSPQALRKLLGREGFEVEKLSTWSLRDGPPALSSSILPDGEPTRQEIKGKLRPFLTLAYLALTWLCTPLEILAAIFGKGSMITVIARKK